MIMAWLAENRRNKLIWNYGFWDGNRARTLAAISWLSTIGLGCFLDMLLWSMSPTFWHEGLSISNFVWEQYGRNISEKSPFKTASFVDGYINFAPLDWYGSWICCSSKCYINSEQLRLETNTPTRKVYIPNSRSLIFRSIRYYSDIGRFNRRRYVNLGYVILMMMMYNAVVWIYWILNLQNNVLSLVWEILNENLKFGVKSMF